MKYSKAHITTSTLAEWQTDLLVQAMAEIGFDSFEQDASSLTAYIPTHQADEQALHALLAGYGVALQQLEECPDENWNSTWEQSHPEWHLPLGVTITPHCAFGAGHHETTSMMINALMTADLKGKRVLDHGTGTGVLAIFAKRLGAAYVMADDIDDNSLTNARENALQNDEEIDVQPALSAFTPASFHLILANIHRNILLEQMAAYAEALLPEGELWLSGFYEADIRALTDAAAAQGLVLTDTQADGEWRMLRFSKPTVAARKGKTMLIIALLLAMMSVPVGCTHRSHLSSRKMVAVLTDLHRADGIMQVSGKYRQANEQTAYYEYVLSAHGVTRAEFDSSLVWYTHHPQRFNKLYPKVFKNLETERALYVGEAEENRLLLEHRKQHFEWYTVQRITQLAQQGYCLDQYDLTSYRLLPVDTIHQPVPYKPD